MEQGLEEERDQLFADFIKEGTLEDRTKYSRQKTSMGKGSDTEMSMACFKTVKKFFWIDQKDQFEKKRNKTEQVELRNYDKSQMPSEH